jgi:hypothetical protein
MRDARALLWATACWAGIGAVTAAAEPIQVRIQDEASGRGVAARVYVWRGDAPLQISGPSVYAQGDEEHILVQGGFELNLEAGTYRLRVERGLESIPAEVEIVVPGEAVHTVPLRRWVDMNAEGWYAADMHVHRDPSDIPLILRAEDLNFAPTITTHVWGDEVNQPWEAPSEFPVIVEPGRRLFTGNAQEIERIQGGPGAVILLARDLPLPFEGYELYPPAVTYTRKVHADGGLVEGDKLFWVDTFVNAALGEIDFIELNCNHFLPREVDMDLAPWSHWPMEFGYRGPKGFALWMMDLYYRILNSGIELPLSAGSANGVKATPVGYDRVYVHLGETPFDYESFMGALKEGRSFSTNGPILELEVDGRYGPGDRVELRGGEEHRLRARARSQGHLETLQLVVNGEVVAEEVRPGSRELTLETSMRLEGSAWAAARAFEGPLPDEAWQPTGLVFAHTSPVYLLGEGEPVVVPDSVRDVLGKIDTLIAHTRDLEGFREERHREETLMVYQQARAVLESRLGSR